MTARKPLFQNNGTVQEIGTGDSVDLAVLGTGTPDSTKYLRGDGVWETPTASAAPAGNTKEVQFNNAGTTAGAANVEIDNGDLCLAANPSPVTPPTDNVKLFGRKLANRMLLAAVGPSGMDACLQPAVWRQKVARWNPPGNSTGTPAVDGISALNSSGGTVTARNWASTNLLTRTKRMGYVSGATAASLTGQHTPAAQYTTGDGAGLGGFFYSCRFAITDAAAVSGARTFVGMSSNVSGPTNVEPSTLTNSVGIAQLSSDATQLYLVYGGSAAQTPIALGTDFPPMVGTGATNGVVYDLTLFSSPNENGVIYYRIERVGTSFVVEGTLSGTPGTTIPANTTALAHRAWRTNNTTALAVGIDILGVYIETDY